MTAKSPQIHERDVQGLKYFRKLCPLFDRLHTVGCARDRAGNRQLHFDQYCALVMLFMFNPIVSSLRAIQQASELKNVQRKLGCSRASLGSLSESARVFDPALLEQVVAELGQQLVIGMQKGPTSAPNWDPPGSDDMPRGRGLPGPHWLLALAFFCFCVDSLKR